MADTTWERQLEVKKQFSPAIDEVFALEQKFSEGSSVRRDLFRLRARLTELDYEVRKSVENA